jgi:hypothetical protein
VVELAILIFGRGPTLPSVRLFENVSIFLAVEFGFGVFVLFKVVEIF